VVTSALATPSPSDPRAFSEIMRSRSRISTHEGA
jgi:hypothetical protein